MSFLSGGLTIWSTVKQHTLLAGLEEKYLQSVILSRVRVASGTLFRRQAMAVLVEAPRGSEHFDELDQKIRKDLNALSGHVSRPEDVAMAQQVARSYQSVVEALETALATATSDANAPVSEIVRPAHEGYQELRALLELHFERNRGERRVLRDRLKRLREAVLFAVGISAFGTLCLVLLLAVYVGSDIFRPLRRLEAAMGSVAEGDLSVRLEVGRDDELGRLTDAFHAMTDVLRERLQVGGNDLPMPRGPSPTLAEVDVRRVMYETVSANQHAFAEGAVSMTVEVGPNLPNLCVEEGHLREVISLILKEALAACHIGARIWLRLTHEDGPSGHALLEVAYENPSSDTVGVLASQAGAEGASQVSSKPLERASDLAQAAGGRLSVDDIGDTARRVVVHITTTPVHVAASQNSTSDIKD